MKNTYEKLFDEFMNITEFRLLKHKDGTFSLKDLLGTNFGDIENDRFILASEVLDRMEIYIIDYPIVDIENALYEECVEIDCNWKEYGKYRKYLPGCEFDFDFLDMIVNHTDKVDLNNCDYLLAD